MKTFVILFLPGKIGAGRFGRHLLLNNLLYYIILKIYLELIWIHRHDILRWIFVLFYGIIKLFSRKSHQFPISLDGTKYEKNNLPTAPCVLLHVHNISLHVLYVWACAVQVFSTHTYEFCRACGWHSSEIVKWQYTRICTVHLNTIV